MLLTLISEVDALRASTLTHQCQADPSTCCVGRALDSHIKSGRENKNMALSLFAVCIALFNGVISLFKIKGHI